MVLCEWITLRLTCGCCVGMLWLLAGCYLLWVGCVAGRCGSGLLWRLLGLWLFGHSGVEALWFATPDLMFEKEIDAYALH